MKNHQSSNFQKSRKSRTHVSIIKRLFPCNHANSLNWVTFRSHLASFQPISFKLEASYAVPNRRWLDFCATRFYVMWTIGGKFGEHFSIEHPSEKKEDSMAKTGTKEMGELKSNRNIFFNKRPTCSWYIHAWKWSSISKKKYSTKLSRTWTHNQRGACCFVIKTTPGLPYANFWKYSSHRIHLEAPNEQILL